VALVEFRTGPLARLTVNYYVDWWKKEGELVEFNGDRGSLCLSHVSVFNAGLEYADCGKPYEAVAPGWRAGRTGRPANKPPTSSRSCAR